MRTPKELYDDLRYDMANKYNESEAEQNHVYCD